MSTAQALRKHAPLQNDFDFGPFLSISQYLLLFQVTNILCTFVGSAGLPVGKVSPIWDILTAPITDNFSPRQAV